MNKAAVEVKGAATWSAAIAVLDEKVLQARSLLHPYSLMGEQDFKGVKVWADPDEPDDQCTLWSYKSLNFLVDDITGEEFEAAPEAIKMVLRDLGLSEPEGVEAAISFRAINLEYSPRNFFFILRPKEFTGDQVGILLATNNKRLGQNKVITAPRFLPKPPRTGREETVYATYVSHMVPSWTSHPYLVDIMCAGADWMSYLLNNRLSSKPID